MIGRAENGPAQCVVTGLEDSHLAVIIAVGALMSNPRCLRGAVTSGGTVVGAVPGCTETAMVISTRGSSLPGFRRDVVCEPCPSGAARKNCVHRGSERLARCETLAGKLGAASDPGAMCITLGG